LFVYQIVNTNQKNKIINTELMSKSMGWQNVIKIIIPYFIIVGFTQFFAHEILGLSFLDSTMLNISSTQALFIEFCSFTATLFVVWLFRKKIDKEKFSTIGFQNSNALFYSIWGILLGLLFMAFAFVVLLFTKQIFIDSIHFDLVDIFVYFLLFIFVAASEELFIRGYILTNLLASFNKNLAILISSLLFSLMHIANDNISLLSLIALFIFGIILALGYIHTKGLWFPIALHFSWNFFQGPVLGFKVSGIQIDSLIKLKINNPNIWNGGDFGIEGSLLSVFFVLLFILFLKKILLSK